MVFAAVGGGRELTVRDARMEGCLIKVCSVLHFYLLAPNLVKLLWDIPWLSFACRS